MLPSARSIAVAAALLVAPSAALAAAAKPVVVALADGENPRASRRLERALRAQFSDLALTLRVEHVAHLPPRTPQRLALARVIAKRRGAIAVLWHDVGSQLYLYFASPHADRLLVRSVNVRGSTDRYEALALLARSHLRTLLAGGRIGISAGPAAATPRSTAPTHGRAPRLGSTARSAPARRGVGVGVELGYALDLYDDEVATTHAAHFGVRVDPWSRVGLWASARFLGRAARRDARAAIALRRVPLSAGVRVVLWRGGRVDVVALAGLGAEIVTSDARAFGGLHAAQNSDRVLAFAQLGAGVSVRLARSVSLFVRVSAALAFNRLRYVVALGETSEMLLSPWRVQPGLRLGLSADLL